MPKEEFKELREALRGPPTPETMKEASEAFKRYQKSKKGKHSRPVLCSLGFKKPYPPAVPLDKMGDQLAINQDLYNLLKRVVEEED